MVNSLKRQSVFLLIFIAFFVFTGCKTTKKVASATKTTEKTEPKTEETTKAETTKPTTGTSSINEAARVKLENYFSSIASSSSVESANMKISEALTMFSSPDIPVIIAFFNENGKKDYDEPTTIKNYLNYLKDQKKNPNKVDDIVYDTTGKIAELDLITR